MRNDDALSQNHAFGLESPLPPLQAATSRAGVVTRWVQSPLGGANLGGRAGACPTPRL
jgi:hypothetical protein